MRGNGARPAGARRRRARHPLGGDRDLRAHPKGLTRLWTALPEELRGTYEALAAEPVLEHLVSLGITTLELLPVHAFADDRWLLGSGRVNYWGYNSIGFFALEPRYFGPAGLAGFRETVRKLHAPDSRSSWTWPTTTAPKATRRGRPSRSAAWTTPPTIACAKGQMRYYCNDTGCGNALDVSHPYVLRLVLDSLRWWVEAMGVDASVRSGHYPGTESHGFDPGAGFFDALRQTRCSAGSS